MTTYEKAGVSIARGDAASADAYKQLSKTFNNYSTVVNGLVALRADFGGMEEPLVVPATDGVGTKLKYAFASGRHETVGIDLVAMCVNDLARNNITPLGFALYRATSRIEPEVMHKVAEGIVAGCLEAGCVYVTGETAEMPGFYQEHEYDLAGFAVGVVDKKDLITGTEIKEGDAVIGLASSGTHSNGFSLIRKIFPPERLVDNPELLDWIMTPTRIYVKNVLEANRRFKIHGWVHVTGGGIPGKLEKIIPDGLQARLMGYTWSGHYIFRLIQAEGSVSDDEMAGTFNMGLGMIGLVPESESKEVLQFLNDTGERAWLVGEILSGGDRKVVIE